MTKIVACIAARMESSRLPGKVLRPLNGYPMNGVLVQRLKRDSKLIDDICICTPDGDANQPIRDAAVEWGVHTTAGTQKDILQNFIDSTEQLGGDHMLRITGDNVFTDPDYIDVMIKAHLEHEAEYTRTENLPLGVTAEVMSLPMAKRLHEMVKDDPVKTQYMLLYSFDPDNFKCCVVEPEPEHNRPYYSCTIDTDEDWERTEDIMKAFPDAEWGPSLTQIIGWMDDHPTLRKNLDPESQIKLPHGQTKSYADFLNDLDFKKQKSIVVKA